MKKHRILQPSNRLDAPGTVFLTAVLALGLTMAVPHASASSDAQSNTTPTPAPERVALDKKFKGKLPITQLTEDEAILHATNRLAYGPRPGDVEQIRQMGLEKWIEQQLHPEAINDADLNQRLQRYPTLPMSSKQLLDEYPRPDQDAKRQGITKEQAKQQYEDQLKLKQQQAESQIIVTGNDNLDKAQQQLAKLQGPNRIIAELSMAKLDRAVYSQRQLEAVMEDFWFNHFNIFAEQGRRPLAADFLRARHHSPPHDGQVPGFACGHREESRHAFLLDNWLSADPAAVRAWKREKIFVALAIKERSPAAPCPLPARFPARPPAARHRPANACREETERGLNENYGREVMELHTVGVDAGYTQQDVIEMAECLTGWTIHEPRRDPEFVFDEKVHAQGKKVVMGHTFDYGGEKDGEEALKMLASEPATAHFISTELARHFVSDNPPQSLIDRMAQKLHREQRRHPRRAAYHDLFARVLVQGCLSRESKDAL